MPKKAEDKPYQRPAANSPTYPVTTIAKLLLLTDRRVQQLSKEGVIPKSNRGRYELAPAVQGYVRYLQERSIGRESAPEDYHTEKSRLVKLQADKAQFEIDELTGKLVRSEEVESAWASMVVDCKTRLLSVPSKAATLVATEPDPAACQVIIEEMVREALQELSEYGGVESEPVDTAGDESLESPTKADSKPVGRPRKKAGRSK